MRAVMTLASIATVALVVAVAAGATGRPIHTQVNDSFSANICGLDVTGVTVGIDNFTPVFDAAGNVISFTDIAQVKTTYTNPENGNTLVDAAAGPHTGTATGDPAGIVTFTDNYIGLPERIYVPGGPVITRDAGIISITTVVDFSTNPDGDVVSQTITVENGPHPEADADFNLFCDVFTQALG